MSDDFSFDLTKYRTLQHVGGPSPTSVAELERLYNEVASLKAALGEACRSESDAVTRLQEVYDLNADLRRELASRPAVKPSPRAMADIDCPKCGKRFTLRWDPPGDVPETLKLSACDSAGVYSVRIECPHCHNSESVES